MQEIDFVTVLYFTHNQFFELGATTRLLKQVL